MAETERPKSVVDALEVLAESRSTWNRLRGTFDLTDSRIENAQSILNDEPFDNALWQTVLEGYDVNTSDASIGSLYDRQQGLCEAAENYQRLEDFLAQYKEKAASLSPNARNEFEKDVGITFNPDGTVNLETVLKFLKDGNSLNTNRFDEFSEAYATEHGGSFDTRKANIKRQVFGKYWASIGKTFAPLGGLLNSQGYVNQVVNQGGTGATLVKKYRGQRQWWALGLTALGVAAAFVTGGAALPLIALLTGASVGTSAAINSHRINQIHQVAALRKQATGAYIAEKNAYINGNSPERQAALKAPDLVFTVSGVHQDRFMTAKTSVNLATGKVLLGGVAEKYAGLVNAYFVDGSGTFDIVPTKEAINTMDNDKIKAMVTDILVHSNLGHRTDSIAVKAGGESHEFSGNEDFVSLARDAQAAKEKAAQEAKFAADTANLNKKINAKLTNREFMDSAVCAALAASVGKAMDAGAHENVIKQKLASALAVEEQALDGADIRSHLNSYFSTYYNRDVKDQNPLIPAAAAAAAIVGLPENSGKEKFVSKFVEVTRDPQNIPELACMAAVVGTGLNKEQIGELQTVIKAVKELQPEEELSNEIKTTAQSVAQAMSISQDNLIAEIRNGLNPVPASPEEEQATTSFFEKIQELART